MSMPIKKENQVPLSGTVSSYETDYVLWKQRQIKALQARDWEAIDVEHLIEDLEITDEMSALESNLIILIAHLIKLYVQDDAPNWMSQSWYNSIAEHRLRIQEQLSKSGTLRSRFPNIVSQVYSKARKMAIKEGKRADGRMVKKRTESEYPMTLPDGWFEKLLDDDWYPNNS